MKLIMWCLMMGLVSLFAAQSGFAATEDVWEKSYTLERKGEYRRAAQAIASLVSDNAFNELATLRIGWLYYRKGSYEMSLRYYRRALSQNRQSMDARLGMMLPLMALKDWQELEKQAKQVITYDRWNYTAHVRLMIAEEAQQQWDVLAKHAAELVKRYPANVEPWLYLARAEAWRNHRAKAIAAYEKVLAWVPSHAEAAKYIQGG